jgi:hypothetical protein
MGEIWEFAGMKMLTRRETIDSGAAASIVAGFRVQYRMDCSIV